MRPGRSPPLVEVEPEVGCVLSDVGIVAQEADTHDRRAIGEAHGCAVPVRFRWWPTAVLPMAAAACYACFVIEVSFRGIAKSGDYVVCLGAGNITQWAYALPAELAALGKVA